MKIYTSYWAQVRNFPKNLIGLNTTVWPPKWRPLGQDSRGVWVIDCPPLRPGPTCEGLCRGECNPKEPETCAFLREYKKQLDEIVFEDFIHRLQELKIEIEKEEQLNDVVFALIVFEAPANPCSERLPLQSWLKDNGIEADEWRP